MASGDSITSEAIATIRQTNSSVPQEVKDLYSKNVPDKKTIGKTKNFDPSKNNKISDYYKKKDTERMLIRTQMFDQNRHKVTNHTPSTSSGPLQALTKDENYIKSQQASLEAKELGMKAVTMQQTKDYDIRTVTETNTKMMIKLQESQDFLLKAISKRDDEVAKNVGQKFNECTDYIGNELNRVQNDIKELKTNDDVESIQTVMACQKDLKKLWIRFTYLEDIEQLRSKMSPPQVVKEIINQMNIRITDMQWPVEAAVFKSKRFSESQHVPETALECTFVNSTITNRVKMEFRKFNNQLEKDNKAHLIRYRVATDWSFSVRRILKICNELRRCDIIAKVMLTNDGIKLLHKEIDIVSSTGKWKTSSSLVNSMKQLDTLRKNLNDFNWQVTAAEVYSSDYFQKPQNERLKIRANIHQVDYDEMEVTVTDDENTFCSTSGKLD